MMKCRKRCCRTPFWGWSYNNPKCDCWLRKIHRCLKELDDLLCAKKPGKKWRK